MNFRNSILYSAMLLALICSNSAIAQSKVNWIGGLSLGYSQFEFEEKLDHQVSFPMANLMLAATYDQWQFSVNGGFSLADADVSEEEEFGDASRSDIDYTIGRKLSDSWSVFMGYKTGETKVTFVDREADDEGSREETNERYKSDGPYFGVSHSWKFEKAGSLNLSIAYAFLNADNDFAANVDDDEEMDDIEFDDVGGRTKGDLEGLSYALTWTMPISAQLLFQSKFKVNDYKMDIDVDGQSFENINQDFSSLQVGLAYVF